MRTFVIIFLTITLVNFTDCTNSAFHPSAMQQAKNYMNTRPDSALILLEGMADSIHAYPKETQMYWHLLTIQAKDKQYITHTSDSLINCIVKFYENHDDKAKRMMAYYYQGRVYRDMNDAPRALKAFQRAEELQVSDKELLTKVYSQMGYLFAYQGLYDEAIRVNRKFVDLYTQLGKENKASYAFRDLARMYDMKGEKDKALSYYQKACQTALADRDSTRYYGIWSEAAGLYCKVGQVDSARQMLLVAVQQPRIRNKSHVYMALGDVYEEQCCWDSAIYYRKKAIETGNIHKAYINNVRLGWMEKKRGNVKEALEYLQEAVWAIDSIRKITETEAIAKINSLYNYQRTEAENARLSLELSDLRNRTFLVGVLVIVVVCAVSVLQYWNNQKRIWREQRLNWLEQQKYTDSLVHLKENENRIVELSKQLDEERKNSSLKQQLLEESKRELEMHNQEIMARRKVAELKVLSLESSDIYMKFHRTLFGEGKVVPEDWEDLRVAIDETYPGFTSNLQMLYPKITLVELQVCWLTKIAVSPTRIAMLINRSCSAVSNIRTRLYRKIYNKEGTAGKFCEFIKGL